VGIAVSGGTDVPVPGEPVTSANYQSDIASVLGVPGTRAAAIAAEYPLSAYPMPDVAFSILVSDANFACPALHLDRWTASRVPRYAYQFNDDHAPVTITPPGALPPVATHGTELPYLFHQPNAPFPATLSAGQQALGRPAVLVGHSYGGAVISQAGSDAKGVVGLVFVAAFAPEAGETLSAINARYPDVPLAAA